MGLHTSAKQTFLDPMPGIWTEERRARAREVALQVKPWLKSTGPKSTEGKARVARNAYRGGVRPMQREVQRECKAGIKALEAVTAWLEMEERTDAWLDEQLAAGRRPTDDEMRRARLKDKPPPFALPDDLIAQVLR